MNKKKNILLIVCILLLIVGIILICLFFSFGKNEKVEPPKKDDEEEVVRKDGYDEFGNKIVVVYETKEEVYDVIVNEYLKKGETITETKEENGCWYYTSSNGRDVYEYCINDPIIRAIATEYVKIR